MFVMLLGVVTLRFSGFNTISLFKATRLSAADVFFSVLGIKGTTALFKLFLFTARFWLLAESIEGA